MKIKLDGVMESLLITLSIRAKDARSENPIINDKKSAEIASQIDYDFSKFENSWASYYGTLSRVKIMDREVRKFMKKNPDCVVVSIGCGLDTRFERIDNGKIIWYNVDFPAVIELRKKFFAENDRVQNIAKSMLDDSWAKEIKTENKKLLIVVEGVLMYLKEEEIKKFLDILTDNFDEFTAHFDMAYKGIVNKSKRHDTVKHINAEFNYGVVDGKELEKLNQKIKSIGLINFTDEMKYHLKGIKKLLIPLFYKANNRLCIYEYRG